MPYHGEASRARWDVQPEGPDGEGLRLLAKLPLAGLSAKRRARLLEVTGALANKAAVAVFEDEVQNDAKLGRMRDSGGLQRPPWLHAVRTRSCVSAVMGYTDEVSGSSDEQHQRCQVDPSSSHGWVTAYTPNQKLLLGYVWPRAHYPWVSLWCSSAGEDPKARGLEFGTTGLHQPFPVLSQHPRIFDLPTFEYLDAGESRQRSFACFLLSISEDFAGVESVSVASDTLVLCERGGRWHEIRSSSCLFGA